MVDDSDATDCCFADVFDAVEAARCWPGCPAHLLPGLARYVNGRIPTGSFLRAMLENDLGKAVDNAEGDCIQHLRDIKGVIFNHVPAMAWGSKAKVAAWLGRKEHDVAEGANV